MYPQLIEALSQTQPFEPFTLKEQPVSRMSAVCFPLFANTVCRPIVNVYNWVNRKTFQHVRVTGVESLPDPNERPVIFISNHLSYLDPPMVGCIIAENYPKIPWSMAKKRLWEQLNYRISFSFLGALPFRRQARDMQEQIENLRHFVSILKAKEPLIIFPEGTIPGEIEPFREGFSKLRSEVEPDTGLLRAGPLVPLLAYVTKAVVVPIGVSGAGRLLPPEIHPGKITKPRSRREHPFHIAFGTPIAVHEDFHKHSNYTLTEDGLKAYMNERLMPAISRLVDFDLHEVPVQVPLQEKDYEKIRDHEARVATQYREAGKARHAEIIQQRLEKVKEPSAKRAY